MTIEKIEHLTDSLKDELIDVWEKSVRSSHHFLSEEDLEYYRPRIRDIYFDAVDLYVIKNPKVVAFMGLSDDMVEMLFVLPSEQGKGYGSALLNYAFEVKHIRKIDVNEQNTEAYQFYLNRGYPAIARDEMDAATERSLSLGMMGGGMDIIRNLRQSSFLLYSKKARSRRNYYSCR